MDRPPVSTLDQFSPNWSWSVRLGFQSWAYTVRLLAIGLLANNFGENIRIFVIGDSSKLSRSLQELITRTEEITKATCGLQLIVAVSYSGQYDIVQACQKIALKVKDGLIEPDEINESLIKQELETNCTEFPYPDQLIRTSWEPRISNFLLWQLAYTELFFAQSLWPDFGEVEFLEALKAFQERQRRYGGRDF
nr:dehydrodolichyl diphosphate synthase 2 [Quercus suber]